MELAPEGWGFGDWLTVINLQAERLSALLGRVFLVCIGSERKRVFVGERVREKIKLRESNDRLLHLTRETQINFRV